MMDAAAEIERMATMLPRICTSETWDSSAGAQFRVKAASTAASIGRLFDAICATLRWDQ
jgi:hypothetical protein